MSGESNSAGKNAARMSRNAFMRIYDDLPEPLRQAMKTVPIDMSAADARKLHNQGFLLSAIIDLFREHSHLNHQDKMIEDFGEEIG